MERDGRLRRAAEGSACTIRTRSSTSASCTTTSSRRTRALARHSRRSSPAAATCCSPTRTRRSSPRSTARTRLRDPEGDDPDRRTRSRSSRPATTRRPRSAFVNFLRSKPAQVIFGENGYRPVLPAAAKQFHFPHPPRVFTIAVARRLGEGRQAVLRPEHRHRHEDRAGRGAVASGDSGRCVPPAGAPSAPPAGTPRRPGPASAGSRPLPEPHRPAPSGRPRLEGGERGPDRFWRRRLRPAGGLGAQADARRLGRRSRLSTP